MKVPQEPSGLPSQDLEKARLIDPKAPVHEGPSTKEPETDLESMEVDNLIAQADSFLERGADGDYENVIELYNKATDMFNNVGSERRLQSNGA